MTDDQPRPARRSWRVLFLAMATLAIGVASAPARAEIRIAQGAGNFTFVDEQGDRSKQFTVYTYLPQGLNAAEARIVFVMHGHGKNAAGYRDVWIKHADKFKFMAVTPLFDADQWSNGDYSYASIHDQDGRPRDPSLWSYSVIEHLFDALKRATGNRSARYSIYGHSEGAQFVHRLVLLLPNARYSRAVAANAGWYTMPTFDSKYPYGLRGSPVTKEGLRQSLGRDFVILLGDRDTDPNHKDLRKTAQAMAQGANRFERGTHFYQTGQAEAKELRVAFGWRRQVVPQAAHENSKMAEPAAALLMAR